MNSSRALVLFAVVIALAGVVIHVGAVFAGPSWFQFFNAPPSIVASARAGTWLAPASALVIAALMGVCALCGASATGLVGRFPLLRVGLTGMAVACLVRALLLPLLVVHHPELRTTFEVVSALIWGTAGVGFAAGVRIAGAGPN